MMAFSTLHGGPCNQLPFDFYAINRPQPPLTAALPCTAVGAAQARTRFSEFSGGDEKALSADLRPGVFKARFRHCLLFVDLLNRAPNLRNLRACS